MKIFLAICLSFCSLLLALQVQASPIRFNLYNSSHTNVIQSQFEQDAPGLSLRVFGFDGNGRQEVTIRKTGLGVTSSNDTNTVLDGRGSPESLHFLFSEQVRLLQTVFESISDGDGFSLSVDAVGNYGMSLVPLSGVVDMHLQGSRFVYGAPMGGDDYRIHSVLVDIVPVATPEPATGLLLAIGVGVIFCLRGRFSF